MRVLYSLLYFFLLPTTVSARVAISEVMWAGSDLSTADEWVELMYKKDPDDPEDSDEMGIAGWNLTTLKSSGEEVMFTFPTGAAIEEGEHVLVSNYAAAKSRLAVEPDFVSTAVSLPNTKLLLRLYDAEGVLIDEVDDGTGAPFAGRNASPKASMERIDVLLSGTDAANWKTAETSSGFDGGGEIFGSPGEDSEDPKDPEESEEKLSSGSSESSESFGSSLSQTSDTPIHISEILPNPIGRDDHEWIELVNTGDEAVDLSGWKLESGTRTCVIRDEGQGTVLEPGEYRALHICSMKLSLTNSSGAVALRTPEGTEVQRLSYPPLGEEVSYGKAIDVESYSRFCVPTPGAPNVSLEPNPRIEVQSGSMNGTGSLRVNLLAVTDRGSLASAECYWDFGDNSRHEGCNPPTHRYATPGHYSVRLVVHTECGDVIERVVRVQVRKDGRDGEDGRDKEEEASSVSSQSFKSFQSSQSSIISDVSNVTYTFSTTYTNIPFQTASQMTASSMSALSQLQHLIQEPELDRPESREAESTLLPWALVTLQMLILSGITAYKVLF